MCKIVKIGRSPWWVSQVAMATTGMLRVVKKYPTKFDQLSDEINTRHFRHGAF